MQIKLTNEVERQAALALAVAYLNTRIEGYEGKPGHHSLYFSFDDFGNLFESLGWADVQNIKITIEPEYKEREKCNP